MQIESARAVLWIAAFYLTMGVVVGLPFVLSGIGRVDPAAKDAPWTFRILVLPGIIAFWPLLLKRWWTARGSA
jgi:hypothetical protein